jgi:hypothetical protein
MSTKLARRNQKKVANPYGFLPALGIAAVAVPVIGIAVGGYALWKSDLLGTLVSAPVLIGGGAGYAVGVATKADDKVKIAYTLLGVGVGWAVQQYVIAPQLVKDAVAVEELERTRFEWTSPSTWYWPF